MVLPGCLETLMMIRPTTTFSETQHSFLQMPPVVQFMRLHSAGESCQTRRYSAQWIECAAVELHESQRITQLCPFSSTRSNQTRQRLFRSCLLATPHSIRRPTPPASAGSRTTLTTSALWISPIRVLWRLVTPQNRRVKTSRTRSNRSLMGAIDQRRSGLREYSIRPNEPHQFSGHISSHFNVTVLGASILNQVTNSSNSTTNSTVTVSNNILSVLSASITGGNVSNVTLTWTPSSLNITGFTVTVTDLPGATASWAPVTYYCTGVNVASVCLYPNASNTSSISSFRSINTTTNTNASFKWYKYIRKPIVSDSNGPN